MLLTRMVKLIYAKYVRKEAEIMNEVVLTDELLEKLAVEYLKMKEMTFMQFVSMHLEEQKRKNREPVCV